jgi:hypothetical protein
MGAATTRLLALCRKRTQKGSSEKSIAESYPKPLAERSADQSAAKALSF